MPSSWDSACCRAASSPADPFESSLQVWLSARHHCLQLASTTFTDEFTQIWPNLLKCSPSSDHSMKKTCRREEEYIEAPITNWLTDAKISLSLSLSLSLSHTHTHTCACILPSIQTTKRIEASQTLCRVMAYHYLTPTATSEIAAGLLIDWALVSLTCIIPTQDHEL